ncbi:hypothetical protein B0J12DRAFT_742912 [Macrophomina phaseolina]|uniref:Mg2+ transporter protein CorA-like/Zinc transport protein ZntB n=1 Tax=Macrophomina phaseolina TaxID=35725 RepID=A0ABQ8G5W4_9PEZI|nr:hypothetical protein B0J12DRAFT_742912 [Macrophomina phaseolina]
MLGPDEAVELRASVALPPMEDRAQEQLISMLIIYDKYRELRPPEEFEDEQKYLDAIENAKNKPMQIMYVPVMSSAEAACSFITVFTLIYLPASFIATLLGTSLFEFGTEDSGILKISPSFWIYVCVIIPLTVVTLVIWYLFKTRHDGKRRQEREE